MSFKTFRKVFRDLLRLDCKLRVSCQNGGLICRKIDSSGTVAHQHIGAVTHRPTSHPAVKAISRIFTVSPHFFTQAGRLYSQFTSKLYNAGRSSALPIFGAFGVIYSGFSNETQEPQPKADIADLLSFLQVNQQKHEMEKHDNSLPETSSKLEDYNLKKRLGQPSSCAAIYSAEHKGNEFAVKIMFNYSFASNSHALRRGFSRECRVLVQQQREHLHDDSIASCLPEHPNVIKVLNVLTEETPCPYDALESYPNALPPRLATDGFGRNKTMCLVMPKYDCSLREYVQSRMLPERESMMLLAQLLESVAHLVENNEAHRDLKSDNILLGCKPGSCPQLVLTDFGCCLSDESLELQLPFETSHVDRGGNSALMAPEIASMKPGPGRLLDYSKSDLWACGAIAYEIFGFGNPFADRQLDSRWYSDQDLPILQCQSPLIRRTIQLLLKTDPDERPTASEAVVMVFLIIHAPGSWMHAGQFYHVTEAEINRWLLKIYLQTMSETRDLSMKSMNMPVDVLLRKCFLRRADYQLVRSALAFLHDVL